MSDLLEAALRYAGAGWHCFPVHGATPAVPWRDQSTVDPDTIRAWWTRWPNANIGVDTGKSGLVVVDVDPGGEYGDFTDATLTAHTGRQGGRHHYFAAGDAGVRNSAGKLAPNVDVRGDGGFVFAPPSVSAKTGRVYQWASLRPVAPLPDHVRQAASAEAERPERADPPASTQANDRWGQRILESEVARIALAPEGERNQTLFQAAANVFEAVKGGHIGEQVARDQLTLAADRAGLEAYEIDRTLQSAWDRTDERHPATRVELPQPTLVGAPTETDDDPGFELLTVADLQSIPPPRWLIDRRLPEGLTALVGLPASGKTFTALDWAATVAATLGPVVYWVGEGVTGFAQRVLAWQRERPHVDLSRLLVVRKAPRLLDPEQLRAFFTTLRRVQPALTVIDTLSRATPGVNENDSENFTRIIDALDQVRDAYGTSALVVHHTNKGGQSARGSGALEGAVDALWRAVRDDDSPDTFTLHADKMKDADEPPPALARIVPKHGSAIVFPSDYERTTQP